MKTKPVWMLLSLLLVLSLFVGTPAAEADGWGHGGARAKRLTGQIDYQFVGHLGMTDDEGRKLIWEGTIEGDITGTMKWWFGPSPAPGVEYLGGKVGYYAGRWEIWDLEGKKLLLAGESAGKTVTPVTPDGQLDGMWDGHGVVTEACRGFNRLRGRRIYETGPVIWAPFPFYGTGIFVIY